MLGRLHVRSAPSGRPPRRGRRGRRHGCHALGRLARLCLAPPGPRPRAGGARPPRYGGPPRPESAPPRAGSRPPCRAPAVRPSPDPRSRREQPRPERPVVAAAGPARSGQPRPPGGSVPVGPAAPEERRWAVERPELERRAVRRRPGPAAAVRAPARPGLPRVGARPWPLPCGRGGFGPTALAGRLAGAVRLASPPALPCGAWPPPGAFAMLAPRRPLFLARLLALLLSALRGGRGGGGTDAAALGGAPAAGAGVAGSSVVWVARRRLRPAVEYPAAPRRAAPPFPFRGACAMLITSRSSRIAATRPATKYLTLSLTIVAGLAGEGLRLRRRRQRAARARWW